MKRENNKRGFIQKRLYTYHLLNDGITFILPTLMASFFILFNLTWFQMGLIFAFNSLATIVGQLIIGFYTDKYKSKLLMKIGLFLLALTSFLMIFSYDFISLLIFAIFSGIALGFQHSIAYATTSRMYKDDKDVMIGKQGAAGDVGKCLAVFSSALLIIFFSSWQLVLLLWSIIIFISFLIIVYNFRTIKFKDYFYELNDNENPDLLSEKGGKKHALSLIPIIYILFLAVYSLLITNLATYLKVEKKGLVSEFSALILGYTLIFGVLGAYFSGKAKKKFGVKKSIMMFGSIIIITLVVYFLLDTSDLILTLIIYSIIGFFLFLIYPQLLAAVNEIFHSSKIGFGYGVVLSLGWLGAFMGSLIGGFLADKYSGDVFLVLGIGGLISVLILALFMKSKERQIF